jgi:hypothetical protein
MLASDVNNVAMCRKSNKKIYHHHLIMLNVSSSSLPLPIPRNYFKVLLLTTGVIYIGFLVSYHIISISLGNIEKTFIFMLSRLAHISRELYVYKN